MKKEKYISERVSYFDHGDRTTIIISTGIDRWKESLLLFWILCWTVCGAYLIYELTTQDHSDQMRIGLFIFISFWFYFEYRIGKVFFWRKWGMEYIRIDEGEFMYKRAIGRYGKVKRYTIDKMSSFQIDEANPKSPVVNIEDSFWFLGGERIKFTYKGKHFKFGRQLGANESKDLVKLINRQANAHRKKYLAEQRKSAGATD